MTEEFNISEFIELAKICRSVYIGPINHNKLLYKYSPLKYQKIIHGSYGRGFCRIFWNDDVLIFAFRGTRENIDWTLTNIKFIPTKYITNNKFNKIFVHKGFQNALYYTDKTTNTISINAIFSHIDELNLLCNRRVIITGHSLGGALAILFFTKLQNKYQDYFKINQCKIVVFGSPAVGFKKFKDHFTSLNQVTYRVTNCSDLVPLTPPLFYRHVGKEVWLKTNNISFDGSKRKKLYFILKNKLKNCLTNHKILDYITNLERLSKNNIT